MTNRDIAEIKQTIQELRINQNILASVLLRLGHYLYTHINNPDLKQRLMELGEELKGIREARKR